MIHFKHFTSLQWFGFASVLSMFFMLLTLLTDRPAPVVILITNAVLALFALLFIEWPSKDGFKSAKVQPALGTTIDFSNSSSRFALNPVEGKSVEEIILWFQQVVDVEFNSQNYSLAKTVISQHLCNNRKPSVRSIIEELERVDELVPFAIELKKTLLF